jgi:hypothetical protein
VPIKLNLALNRIALPPAETAVAKVCFRVGLVEEFYSSQISASHHLLSFSQLEVFGTLLHLRSGSVSEAVTGC